MALGPVLALLAAAEIGVVAPALAPPPDKTEFVTHPAWVRRPTGQDMARVYPPRAVHELLDGLAVIDCAIAADGTLHNCDVAQEAPAGEGFGKAAVKLSLFFKMSPTTADGASVSGRKIRVPIRWNLGSVSGPKFISEPSREELDAVWPKGNEGIPGLVVINCIVSSEGVVSDCRVRSETPKGRGFGAAALELAPKLRLGPATVDGQPVGERSLIQIDFTLTAPKPAG